VGTVVDAATLARRLGAPDLVLLDTRFRLADPAAGRELWEEGHLPTAHHADLDRHLSSPVGPGTGRHPLPEPESLAHRLCKWGIRRSTSVVVYDDAGGAIAARAWWLLRWLGHEDVAVLDGGLAAWLEDGGRLERGNTPAAPASFTPRPRPRWVVGTPELAVAPHDRPGVLVDVREPVRYRGLEEPIDPVAGHVPGAVNLPWQGNLGPDGRLLPQAPLAERYRAVIGDSAAGDVVFMCGSGVTACHGLLGMAHAGLGDGRLYAGSWSEWILDPARPVAGPDAGAGLADQ
jgi:thiosulfate/3-mercaptopyruvate sulfurtransferase